MFRQALLARAAFLAAAACVTAPAAASAASVDVENKCYVADPGDATRGAYGEPIDVEVGDLEPGRQVRLTVEVKGQQTASTALLTASRRGEVMTQIEQWVTGMPPGPTRKTDAKIVVRDFWLGTELGSADIDVTNLGVHVDSGFESFGTRRRWILSGVSLLGGANKYYAHYFQSGKAGAKYLGRQYLGSTTDRCGFMRVWRPLSPVNKLGTHYVKIQASATYNPKLYSWGAGISIVSEAPSTPATPPAPAT